MRELNEDGLPCSLLADLKAIDWLEPWWCFILEKEAFGLGLEKQLRVELGTEHELFDIGQKARAIAKREDCDDVLFWLPEVTKPFALVHLIWSNKPSDSPTWPKFIQLNDLQELHQRVLLPAYQECDSYE